MAKGAKIRQLLDEYFQIRKEIFTVWHATYDREKSEALNAKKADYINEIIRYLDERGKVEMVDQFSHIVSDGTPSCYRHQMLEQFRSGDKDSYYKCLDQQAALFDLILNMDGDFSQVHNTTETANTYTFGQI